MGKSKNEIASVFKLLHYGSDSIKAVGTLNSKKGTGFFNHILWWIIGVPAGLKNHPIELVVDKSNTTAVWIRNFGKDQLITHVRTKNDYMKERSGIIEFQLKLNYQIPNEPNSLKYEYVGFSILKIPMPKFLGVYPNAHSKQISDKAWTIDMEVRSPFGGLVVHYWGEVEIESSNKSQ